jgi:hypothetical protein
MIQKIISNNNENIKLEISEENIESVVDNIYNLTIMSIFKNETMNLKMWLDHYLWQGVEHFYLIDNGSTDNPYDILQEYIDKGVVTYYYIPEKHQQVQHYRYIFDNEKLKEKTKWLCVCDLDEFFFGTKQILAESIKEFDNYNVIYTNSFFYGSDNLIEHPSDIRTAIIYRQEDMENGIKYIFKPTFFERIIVNWTISNYAALKSIEKNGNKLVVYEELVSKPSEVFAELSETLGFIVSAPDKIKNTKEEISKEASIKLLHTLRKFNLESEFEYIKSQVAQKGIQY